MRRLLYVLSDVLLGAVSNHALVSCVSQNKELDKDGEFNIEINQDIETFNKITIGVRQKFETWWQNKKMIDINMHPDQIVKFDELRTTLETDKTETLIGDKINKWPFFEQLINDFKKEVNVIKEEIANKYVNFYQDSIKTPPILLEDNNVRFILSKININKITKLFAENKESLKAITVSFDIAYEVKFKELQQRDEIKGLIIISNDMTGLINVQEKMDSWWLDFIDNLFGKLNHKIIDESNNNFNSINMDNTIWPLIKKELNDKNILFNGKPIFARFFDTLGLWSSFYKSYSILNWIGEGYQPEELTAENFLKFYKKKNNIMSEDDFYVKANIWYFIPINLTIENLPFKEKYYNYSWRNLKSPIKILLAKEKVDQKLNQFAIKTVAFWHYYKLETYDDKLVFNMNQADFAVLLEKINSFKSNSSINSKILLIFDTIFDLFNDTIEQTAKFKIKINSSNYKDSATIVPKFKVETVIGDKVITVKLFRSHYVDGSYPNYYLNFSYNDFGYSFFFKPDVNEKNNTNDNAGKYQFLQTVEFKVK